MIAELGNLERLEGLACRSSPTRRGGWGLRLARHTNGRGSRVHKIILHALCSLLFAPCSLHSRIGSIDQQGSESRRKCVARKRVNNKKEVAIDSALNIDIPVRINASLPRTISQGRTQSKIEKDFRILAGLLSR